ncbi:hypothetical protein HPP92_006254 [Vanilla planifolia]|uniref:Uncharacterized protein n=1 Tax=Vanilla planifolia TaxID=51239 RepID=A0A835RMX3_VANPL|nr:hypothetical protein HPP92_006254 [Vanilla planifolia]
MFLWSDTAFTGIGDQVANGILKASIFFMPQSSPYSENEMGKKQTPLAQFLKFEKEDQRPVKKQEHERSHGIKTYGSSKQDISDHDVTDV